MTQAFNLSQLANGANTSGQLNASNYLYNQVPVANGGTALSSAGATGNMLIASSASAYSTVKMPTFSYRNRIINGDMRIDQRNAGASVTPANSQYLVDRWQAVLTAASKYSLQRNAAAVTPPASFTNYLGATSLSAYSVISSDAFAVVQGIEGFNVADLGWGTANAQTVTLSFWVRSSLTGAFGGSFYNGGATRSYPFTFTVSAANTWEQKTITVAGDTTGTWLTDNGGGIFVRFSLGAGATFSGTAGAWAAGNIVQPTGSVSVVGTSGATFYITGVQLEAGSVATPFERRPYGTELQLCSRYYQKSYNDSTTPGTATTVGAKWSGAFGANDLYYQSVAFNQSMRASATVRIFNVNNGNNNQLSEYTINPTTFATNRAIAIKDAGQAGVSIDGAGQLANGRLYAYHFDATAEL